MRVYNKIYTFMSVTALESSEKWNILYTRYYIIK